ncbi:MAG: hypothetical protein ABUL64_02645 [Singulisphaera sp.]
MKADFRALPRLIRGMGALATVTLSLSVAWAGAGETLDERRARIAQMDPQQREQLGQNYDRFQRLDPAEQDRLRALSAEIDADPQSDELRKTMHAYYDWLSELPASQRIMLSALPAEERLKRIDELRGAQAQGRRFRLTPPDVKAVNAWITRHDLPKRWAEAQRGGTPAGVTPEELADLRSSLSEPAQQALDANQGEEEQRRLVRSWVFQARIPGWSGDRRGMRRPSTDELHELFKNDLTDNERAYLRALPPEQMQRELGHLWREHRGKQGDPQRDGLDARSNRRSPGKTERTRGDEKPPD